MGNLAARTRKVEQVHGGLVGPQRLVRCGILRRNCCLCFAISNAMPSANRAGFVVIGRPILVPLHVRYGVSQDLGFFRPALESLFMDASIRSVLTFKSDDFNTSVQKNYFINPGCYGDDLAKWIIGQLQERGFETDATPGQEDFGWYLNFNAGHKPFTLVLGYRPGNERRPGTWIGWLESKRGFAASFFGGRSRGLTPTAIEAIHGVLTSNPHIQDLRWHTRRDFDAGHEENGSSTPW